MKVHYFLFIFILSHSLYANEKTQVRLLLESGEKNLNCLAKVLEEDYQHIFCKDGDDIIMVDWQGDQVSAFQNQNGEFKKAQVLSIENKNSYQAALKEDYPYVQDDQKFFNDFHDLDSDLRASSYYPLDEEESEVLKLKKIFQNKVRDFRNKVQTDFNNHTELEVITNNGQKINCKRGSPNTCLLYSCDPITIDGKTYQVQFNNTTLINSLKTSTLILVNSEEIGPSLKVEETRIKDRTFYSSKITRPSPFEGINLGPSHLPEYEARLPRPFVGEVPELQGKKQTFAILDDSYSQRMRDYDLTRCTDPDVSALEHEIQNQYRKLKDEITQKQLIELVRFTDGKINRELILENEIKPSMCHMGGDVWAVDKENEELLRNKIKGSAPKAQPISYKDLDKIFTYAREQKDIPWGHYQDGCYARAHTLSEKLSREMGIETEKIWAFGQLSPDSDPNVNWRYHVATKIDVMEEDGSKAVYVLDPSVAGWPLKESEWIKKINPKKFPTMKSSWPPPSDTGIIKQVSVSYSPWEVYSFQDDNIDAKKKSENISIATQENKRYQKVLNAK